MTIDRLIDIVKGNSLKSLLDDRRIILSGFEELGLKTRDKQNFMEKILES